MAPRSLLFSVLASYAYAQSQFQQAQFNQVLNVNGDMNLNAFQFPDGSRIETFSQTQRQLIVNQNPSPLSANMVTGSTSGPFTALQQNSIVVQTNGATDLVGAQMELAMNQQAIQQVQAQMGNVYVAKLSQDRQSWTVQEPIRSVNATDMTVRMVKMNLIDGEYQVLARQNPELNEALVPFGTSGNSVVQINGSGIQEAEFNDGFRMSIRSSQPMTMNTVAKNGVSTSMLSALGPNVQTVNTFRYLVTTNLAGVQPTLNQQVAVVQIPLNAVRLQSVAQQMGATAQSNMVLNIAQRPVQANPGGATGTLTSPGTTTGNKRLARRQGSATSGVASNPAATNLLLSPTFVPINQNAVFDAQNNRVAVPVSQIDGEYIITVGMQGATGQTGQTGQTGTTGTTGTAGTTGTTGTTGTQPQAAGAAPAAGVSSSSVASGAQPGTAASSAPAAAQPAAAGVSSAPAAAAPAAAPSAPAAAAEPAPSAAAEPAPPAAAEPAPAAAAPAPAASPAQANAAPAADPAAEAAAAALAGEKRQSAPLLSGSATTAGQGVVISMAQIQQMATIQIQGGSLLIGQMLTQVGGAGQSAPAFPGSTALQPAAPGAGSPGVSVAGAGTTAAAPATAAPATAAAPGTAAAEPAGAVPAAGTTTTATGAIMRRFMRKFVA